MIAIGGSGIKPMQRYWERATQRVEQESGRVKQEVSGRDQHRLEERKEQAKPSASSGIR